MGLEDRSQDRRDQWVGGSMDRDASGEKNTISCVTNRNNTTPNTIPTVNRNNSPSTIPTVNINNYCSTAVDLNNNDVINSISSNADDNRDGSEQFSRHPMNRKNGPYYQNNSSVFAANDIGVENDSVVVGVGVGGGGGDGADSGGGGVGADSGGGGGGADSGGEHHLSGKLVERKACLLKESITVSAGPAIPGAIADIPAAAAIPVDAIPATADTTAAADIYTAVNNISSNHHIDTKRSINNNISKISGINSSINSSSSSNSISKPCYSPPAVSTQSNSNSRQLLLCVFAVCLALCTMAQTTEDESDVSELGGDSDFNRVRLHWRYPRMGPQFRGFKVTHCEDQAWGQHRCRNTVFKPTQLTQKPLSDGTVEYSGSVPHLRMATNYTMHVTPLAATPPTLSPRPSGRAIDGSHFSSHNDNHHGTAQVFIQTKGFSARAVSCLTNSTLVEVDTGPNFGGKISVEGSLEEGCATHGNTKDSISKYRLNINHALCGSKQLGDSVRTYILVQENLPILTHSTRRFMVVCHYVPEAFTVSAGVSLPEQSNPGPLIPVDHSVNEVDPSELFDATNDIFRNSGLSRRQGKALKLKQPGQEGRGDTTPGMWTQLVLMVILVVGAVVGLSCAFWHFGRHAGFVAGVRGESLAPVSEEMDSVTSIAPRDVIRHMSYDHQHGDDVIDRINSTFAAAIAAATTAATTTQQHQNDQQSAPMGVVDSNIWQQNEPGPPGSILEPTNVPILSPQLLYCTSVPGTHDTSSDEGPTVDNQSEYVSVPSQVAFSAPENCGNIFADDCAGKVKESESAGKVQEHIYQNSGVSVYSNNLNWETFDEGPVTASIGSVTAGESLVKADEGLVTASNGSVTYDASVGDAAVTTDDDSVRSSYECNELSDVIAVV